jgi:hypothetical protein
MTRADLVRFATRDWSAIADEKARHWVERKRTMSPADVLRLGDDLRRYARAVRPDWPTEADRATDADVHCRVSEALRAVAQPAPR